MSFEFAGLDFEVAPYRLSGTVYGTLLNQRSALAALGEAVSRPPYQAPPKAPVLYLKPRNTLSSAGAVVPVPADVPELEVGATLGLVIGRTACKLSEAEALDYVAGYTIVNDVSVPHDSYYRPSLRYKVRDGFCPIGPRVVPRAEVADPHALAIRVYVDGVLVQQADTGDLVRPIARLLAEVTDFMTLAPGDVLMVGVAAGAPRVRAGQQVAIEIDGLGRLENSFQAEPLLPYVAACAAVPPTLGARRTWGVESENRPQRGQFLPDLQPHSSAMGQKDGEKWTAAVDLQPTFPKSDGLLGTGPRGRVGYGGAIHEATPHAQGVRLADGRVLAEDAVLWLPPFELGTIFALGLNYADHAKELAFSAQQEPLAFLKGPGAIIGHRAQTRRPADAQFMHYECELAVVIGRRARNVPRSHAYAHVAGYTVANDYAIRNYLENYYRPNLRVKNRDTCTVLGPWFVDAADVGTPHFALRTLVNGQVRQQGHTRDLVFDVPALIEYLSSFMTLMPGDVILTGTPEGVVDVQPGDEVVTEIDGIGRLVNTIVGDAMFNR